MDYMTFLWLFGGAVLLSIQKILQESTGSAGLLIFHNRPNVSFKKVALNFPPLEQGPAGNGPSAPASRL